MEAVPTTDKLTWHDYLKSGEWTTYLAYQLRKDPKNDVDNPVDKLLKYEALLTQCSYLSRMAYCPADIFCRMTQHLDVTPNAFNNYIRAIEKIYERLFDYKCSYDSKYILEHKKFSEYFEPFKTNPKPAIIAESMKLAGGAEFNNNGIKTTPPIGFFIRNNKNLNVYLYVHDNPGSKFNSEKTLFITFKGSSSIDDFLHDLKSATKGDRFLRELNENPILKPETEIKKNNSKTKNTEQPAAAQNMTYQVNNNFDQLTNPKPVIKNNKSKPSNIQPLATREQSGGIINNSSSIPPVSDTEQPAAAQNNISQGKAGYGFIDVLKDSIPELCAKINELKSQEFKRVIITGHSLGGALASLFGYYLKKYNPTLVSVPIHVITFGACCVFDAPGRNQFNYFLNISDDKPGIFTLDRVTANADPVIILPVDLDHPGYTLLKTEIRAFTKTGRTNEIGEIRKMLELKSGYDGNDLLLSEKFVNLFTNSQDFKGTGKYDTDLYRSKYRIKFGTNAKEQQLILKKAMPDSKEKELIELFKTIESETANKRYNNQAGGLFNNTKKKRQEQGNATKIYKENTTKMMPNQINYTCYKTMTMGFCHAAYMGVSYIMVLRLPSVKGGFKRKKEPTKDYTLYKKDGRIFSIPKYWYKNNSDCLIAPNVSKVNKNGNGISKNNNRNKSGNPINSGKNNKQQPSWKNKFTGFFKSKPKNNKKEIEITSIGNDQKQSNARNSEMINGNGNGYTSEKKNGAQSTCSIL